MNKKNILFLLLSLTMVWTGCTKEDFSDCPEGFWVTFVPENTKHNLTREIQSLDLYFYDENDDLAIDRIHYTRQELRPADGAAYITQDMIPAGNYRLLAIVNGDIHTQTTRSEQFSTVTTRLNDAEIDYQPVNVFTGESFVEIEAYPTAGETIEFPVQLYKHNNQIRINIIYDQDYELPAGGRIDTYIHGSNGQYYHSTRSCRSGEGGDTGTYVRFRPWESFERLDPKEGVVSEIYLSTMHMWHGSDLNLHFDEVGGTRAEDPTKSFDLNLTDLLKQVERAKIDGETVIDPYDTDEELRQNDEYEIWIKFGKTFISTRVGIDNWAVVGGNIDI